MDTQSYTQERELVQQVSRDCLWETNSRIAQYVRLSGSADERKAVEYIRDTLDEYGLRTTLLEHPALVSGPLESSLEVIDANGVTLARYDCLGHAFSASADIEGDLMDVGDGSGDAYARVDVRGKLALVTGLATPTGVYAAERAGAMGEIFVNDEYLHNMIVSTIWGTPTPQSAQRIPTTPAVSIVERDGADLRERLKSGDVRGRLHTKNFFGWQTTPIVIGELDGRATDQFVLFSGHQDSWHYGAMDNGSANATMLEVARLLAQQRDELYRGVRLAFWSGHSHGRYSGSTWYVDNHWEELYERCAAHVNVDSTGARGATFYGRFLTHKELADFGASVIHEHSGQPTQARRMSRAGDMSFNGIGIPSLFMSMSQVPVSADESGVSAALSQLMDGKMPWWWHTSEDTMDKVDLDVLTLDTQIYVSTLWRLCHEPLLPFDFRPVIADMQQELTTLQQAAGAHFDLSMVRDRIAQLASCAAQLADRAAHTNDDEAELLNRKLIALSRSLIPITYTEAGRFDHDPAWPIPFMPGLQGAKQLAQLNPQSDDYQFLKTQLTRNRNALLFALREALAVLQSEP